MANFNDLIMTSSSETSIDNGMISIYTGENPVLVNGFCKILKINNEKIINKYLFYLFNNKKYRKLISNCSNGITRHNIL
jgi:restriction endonuclease S subunit